MIAHEKIKEMYILSFLILDNLLGLIIYFTLNQFGVKSFALFKFVPFFYKLVDIHGILYLLF
jgi:hypothetical protein